MNKIETILKETRDNTEYTFDGYSWNIETNLQIHERLYGKNSAFLVNKDYHGKYEDDYCYFTYYSNVTGEYFKDEWTTAFACPHFDHYLSEKNINEAEKENLIDIKIWNEAMEWLPKSITIGEYWIKNPTAFYESFKLNPIVKIYRGRTRKNHKGFYIGNRKIEGWNDRINMAVIFDLDSKDFFMVKESYIKMDEEYISEVDKLWVDFIESENKVNDRLRKFTKEIRQELIENKYFDGNHDEWWAEICEKEYKWWLHYQDEQEKKKYAPTEKLLQWVRDHFKDVTDEEEIYQIAFKINKKNSRW